MKPLIIGIDPGSTSALAITDLDGEVIEIKSGKNFPPSQIIEEIVDAGRPVIVASDKKNTPSNVEKISNSVGAYTYNPGKDISQKRKRELGEGENSHERDASAAAKFAYKDLRNNIKKLKKIANENDEELKDLAKRYFDPDKELLPEEKENDRQEKKNPLKKKANKQQEKIQDLKKRIGELEDKIEIKEKQRRKMQSKYDKLKAEEAEKLLETKEIAKREDLIDEKNKEIEKLESKLNQSLIREKQYQQALSMLENGAEILPLTKNSNPGKTPFVTKSREFRNKMREKGEKVYYLENIKGLELGDRFILKDTNEDAEDIINRYQESR